MKLKSYFTQLATDLKPMTFTQKLDHIWTYNKELILIAVFLIFIVGGLLISLIQKPNVVFCGFIINSELQEQGTNYLTNDYLSVLGGSGKDEVQLISGIFNTTLASAGEASNATKMQILALSSDRSLDFVIGDKVAMEAVSGDGICMDIRTLLTDEEYALWQDKILTCKLEDGTEIPYAVNITDTKFVKDNATSNKELYLCFIENAKSVEHCRGFWEHILNWQ